MNENMDLSPPVAVCVCDSVDESGTGGSEELICSHIWLLVIGQGLANLSGHWASLCPRRAGHYDSKGTALITFTSVRKIS